MSEAEYQKDYDLARRMHAARRALRVSLLEVYSGANTASDGTLAFDQEYLLATGAAPAGG